MLLCYRGPSGSEDGEEDEEKEAGSGTWQTSGKRNVCAALPFTGPPPGMPV
jgi:hypothetical protein